MMAPQLGHFFDMIDPHSVISEYIYLEYHKKTFSRKGTHDKVRM